MHIKIITKAAQQGIGAGPTVQHIITIIAKQLIIARTAMDEVHIAAAVHDVVATEGVVAVWGFANFHLLRTHSKHIDVMSSSGLPCSFLI